MTLSSWEPEQNMWFGFSMDFADLLISSLIQRKIIVGGPDLIRRKSLKDFHNEKFFWSWRNELPLALQLETMNSVNGLMSLEVNFSPVKIADEN